MSDYIDEVCKVADAMVAEREEYVRELSDALAADGFAHPDELARECWKNHHESCSWASQEEVLALFD